MIKAELVRDMVVEGMEFKTKKEAKEVAESKIKEINDLVAKIGDSLEKDEKARLGNLEISKVEVGAKDGEMTLKDGSKKAWHKDAEVVVKVKLVK